MFCGIKLIRAYTNDLLIITKGDLSNHLNKLELVLKNLRVNGLKCDIEKSLFGKPIWNIWVSGRRGQGFNL